MIDNPDLWRAASLLLDRYGRPAPVPLPLAGTKITHALEYHVTGKYFAPTTPHASD